MKKGIYLNKLHRHVGIFIAPFLVIQTLSGLLLDFGLFRRGSSGTGMGEASHARNVADTLLAKLHFGPGTVNDCYHLVLGVGVIWMALSGWALYLRIRKARKKSMNIIAPGGAA
jgi:uncharacterized iron-regulated membrane protein